VFPEWLGSARESFIGRASRKHNPPPIEHGAEHEPGSPHKETAPANGIGDHDHPMPDKEMPHVSTATPRVPSDDALAYEFAGAVRRLWWVPLILGILWIIFSLIVFRFDTRSVAAVGVLIGVVFLVAGIEELVMSAAVRGGWRWLHAILGVALIIGAAISFAHPGNTFLALAEIVGWLLVIKGVFDIVLALSNRDLEMWWLRLVLGLAEIGLALLISGDLNSKALFLLIFIGAAAMLRGVALILVSFQLRSLD
jgi:uncharacterized membrane protein HdeD (DUF308 family)